MIRRPDRKSSCHLKNKTPTWTVSVLWTQEKEAEVGITAAAEVTCWSLESDICWGGWSTYVSSHKDDNLMSLQFKKNNLKMQRWKNKTTTYSVLMLRCLEFGCVGGEEEQEEQEEVWLKLRGCPVSAEFVFRTPTDSPSDPSSWSESRFTATSPPVSNITRQMKTFSSVSVSAFMFHHWFQTVQNVFQDIFICRKWIHNDRIYQVIFTIFIYIYLFKSSISHRKFNSLLYNK